MQIKMICIISIIILFTGRTFSQTIRSAGTEADFNTAYTSSATGDIINITNNIVITSEKSLSKTITINGNGFTISVPNPGLDDMGVFSTSASIFRVFNISGSVTVIINQLTIKGGSVPDAGGAITVAGVSTLHLNNCTVCNSRVSSFNGGGGINNAGVTYLSNSLVLRNASQFGGGFLNTGTMFVENSTFSENRSTAGNGGGGAGENQNIMYFNNSTIANNQSTEIGGGINNNGGTIYMANNSVTGNVGYGGADGGGIGNNGGHVYAVNTLFAYNYHRSAGSVTSPTAYVLDDISGANQVYLYYCIYHASLPVGTNNVIGNINYPGLADGSNNSIITGGSLAKITDGTGTEIGTAYVFKPFLYNNNSIVAPTLQVGGFPFQAGNKGTQTRFANNNNSNPTIAYFNLATSTWVDIINTSNSGQLVTADQLGVSRSSPPTIGAIETGTGNLYMVKINAAANGTVNGGTIYGNVYTGGASVTVTAIPYTGYSFVRWDYVLGGRNTASTDNPYTFMIERDITLVPVFQASSGYNITYVGNGNTGGTAPATANFSLPATISDPGTLVKTGYIFNGWNTNSNGSGTNYSQGDTYSSSVNLTLYAQWQTTFLPTVTTTAISAITPTSATSGGNVIYDGGYAVTARGVCWNTTGIPTIANNLTSDGTGTGSYTSSITGLSVGDIYYARAYATNSIGTSYGSQLSIIYTGPAVTTTAISAITSTSATSGGNVTSDGSSSVTARGVCWNTTGNPTIADNLTSDGTGTGGYTSSITGLSVSNTYYVRAYATNSIGTSYGSQLSIIYTSPTVTTTAISSVTPTSATSGGNVTSDGGSSITARGVCWNIAGTPTIADNLTSDGTGTGSYTSSITGLTGGTTYYVRAYATNSVGTSYGSQLSIIYTIPTVTTTAISSITPTSATSGGNVTSNGGSSVTARGVCWNTTGTPTIADNLTSDGTGTGSYSSSITGLTSGATYYVRAYAANSVGTSYGSQLSFLATADCIPSASLSACTRIWITRVATTGGITNFNNASACSATTYTDYSSLYSVSKAPGGVVNMSFTANTSGKFSMSYSVWIDFNNDGIFSTVEKVVAFTNSARSLIVNTSFTVPVSATPGQYRMRIRGDFTVPSDPCAQLAAGETEDYQMNVIGAPTITTTAISDITSTSATSGGDVTNDGGSSVTAHGVCWNTTGTPTTTNSSTTDGTGTGSFTSSITGLTANTLYYVRAYATNSIGTAYGNEVSFTPLRNSQIVTFDPLPTKTFGDSDFPPVASASSGLAVTFSSSNPDVATIVSSDIHIAGAGTAVITASQAGDATWLPASATQIFTVNKSDQTITFDAIPVKTYGNTDTDPLASATSGLTIAYSSDNTSVVTIVSGKIHITGAGTANIAANQTGNTYYNAATEVIQILTVSKAKLTVTSDPKSKIYGSVNPALTIQYSGFVNGDDESLIDIKPVTSTAADIASNTGTYVISAAGGVDNNYDFSYVDGVLTINKSSLIVTSDNKTKVYGSDNPILSISYSGFVLDEDQSVVDVVPVIETGATRSSDAGTYDIEVSGGADNNYSFSYNKGILTIIKADQIITFEEIPAGLRMTQEHHLNAVASSGLPVTFETSDPIVGSLNGSILEVNKEGNLTITAIQLGDHNWNPANDVIRSIVTLPTFDNISSLFSPNNDGMNDYWYIPNLEQYGKLQVTVYNRFGQKVYHSDSYKNDWDGSWNGYALPSASYYYIMKSSEKGMLKGVVNLVR